MSATLKGALAAIIAEPDCCAASKAIARAGLSEEAQRISDREAALTELMAALGAARTMLRRAANTAKTVSLSRDLDRQADELDDAIARANPQ